VTKRPSVVLALAGAAIAAAAMVWPMRAHHATWAVTVGTGSDGTEQTNYVSIGGGRLVTPIQLLIEGTAPEETATRSALKTRVLEGAAGGALALGAGLTAVRNRRGGH
jgi:hypothetical protein